MPALLAAGIAALLPATAAPFIGTVTGATVIANVAFIGGGLALSLLGRPKVDVSATKETLDLGEGPALNFIGRGRIGGLLAYGNTKDADRFRVICRCKGEIDGIERDYLGSREVVLNADGWVVSPPFNKLIEHTKFVRILDLPGDGTEVAWADLITAFPQQWTEDHAIPGIAQSLLRFVSPGISDGYFLKLYQEGVPDSTQVLRGKKLYDPRTTLTKWSENGILGALHLRFPEMSIGRFDATFIGDEADRADVLVDTLTGTEPRSRLSGGWASDTPRGDLWAKVLDSVGAEIIRRPGNLYGIRLIDDERTADVTLPAQHILRFDWKSGPEAPERPNRCVVKYYSPERNYQMTEINLAGIPWAIYQDEIDRYGEKLLTIELPFCFSASQAQRIARRQFAMARADTGICVMNMVGLSAWGCRVASIETDDIGTLLCQILPPRCDDDRGEVEIPFLVLPVLSEWAPETDEAPAPTALPDTLNATALSKPNAPTLVTVAGGNTTIRFPSVGDPFTVFVEAAYRTTNADGNPNRWQSFAEPGPTDGWMDADPVIDLTGIPIEVRIRTHDADDSSPWSDIASLVPGPETETFLVDGAGAFLVDDAGDYLVTPL